MTKKSIYWNTELDETSKSSFKNSSKNAIPEFSFTPSHKQSLIVKNCKTLMQDSIWKNDESRNRNKRLTNYQSNEERSLNTCLTHLNKGKTTFNSSKSKDIIKSWMSSANIRKNRQCISNGLKANNKSTSNIVKDLSEWEVKSSDKS